MDDDRFEIEPDPVIEVYKKDIDRTLIRENRRLTVEQRIENLMGLQALPKRLSEPEKRPQSANDRSSSVSNDPLRCT